ncbi:hypothetical protein CIHG_06100 [Coccidioides immitis H538.4]|uniref:Uncharacterized protein n=1 Tax=Coccidioides immitis H538.4 TaxID=396776 RepID=A0A0J8RU46_COCIT|nr:hypothetical protein CIHG_06100 [Coccidioides immitis H538.4]
MPLSSPVPRYGRAPEARLTLLARKGSPERCPPPHTPKRPQRQPLVSSLRRSKALRTARPGGPFGLAAIPPLNPGLDSTPVYAGGQRPSIAEERLPTWHGLDDTHPPPALVDAGHHSAPSLTLTLSSPSSSHPISLPRRQSSQPPRRPQTQTSLGTPHERRAINGAGPRANAQSSLTSESMLVRVDTGFDFTPGPRVQISSGLGPPRSSKRARVASRIQTPCPSIVAKNRRSHLGRHTRREMAGIQTLNQIENDLSRRLRLPTGDVEAK